LPGKACNPCLLIFTHPLSPLFPPQWFKQQRNFDVEKAKEMLLTALLWRDVRQPHTLTATSEEFEFESRTGKIFYAGKDRWERPVLIFNNSVRLMDAFMNG